jgi:glycosyltransferase involved in cell wall biosynthesis
MREDRRRILTLVSHGLARPDEKVLRLLEASDRHPRVTIFGDALSSDVLDEKFLANAPRWRRTLYKLLPMPIAQVLEAIAIAKKYDAVISWSEKLGLPFALLMRVLGKTVPHVGLFGWPAKGEKAFLLRHTYKQFDRIVMWSTVQRNKVVHDLRVPAERIAFIKWPVDQQFFRPIERTMDMICAVGSEMRDYPTLIRALDGLGIPCHIAAGTLINKKSRWVKAVEQQKQLPFHIVVGKKTLLELRELYARSRFVVIPLHETETDNGITCILEAFAMGKAVICSRTIGQIDVIEEGTTGLFVPVHDVEALRKAIVHLWNSPQEAERMGRAARHWIERYATLDGFVHNIEQIVESVLAERRGQRSTLASGVNARSEVGEKTKYTGA